MRDPAGEIAASLTTSLADRFGLRFEPGRKPDAEALVLGMQTLDMCLKELVSKGLISREHAREKARTPDGF